MEQKQIAVIDDDEPVRTGLSGLVRSLGFRVEAFASAEAFLESGAVARSHGIVTDIHMGGMSGIDLMRRLTADGVTVPVIAITAHAERSFHDQALAAGAIGVLRKPFTAEALIECLERGLGPV